MSEANQVTPIDAELLALLRCPVGVREDDGSGDPGRLRLVHDCWLVCDQTTYKYPIRDGIPIMLEDVGKKFMDTAEKDLPVPPPMV